MTMAVAVPRGERPCLFHPGLMKHHQAERSTPGIGPSMGAPVGVARVSGQPLSTVQEHFGLILL